MLKEHVCFCICRLSARLNSTNLSQCGLRQEDKLAQMSVRWKSVRHNRWGCQHSLNNIYLSPPTLQGCCNTCDPCMNKWNSPRLHTYLVTCHVLMKKRREIFKRQNGFQVISYVDLMSKLWQQTWFKVLRCLFLKPVPEVFHLCSNAALSRASRSTILLYTAPVVPQRGYVTSKQRAKMTEQKHGTERERKWIKSWDKMAGRETTAVVLEGFSAFRFCVCVCMRRRSPNSTQVFHSELI